ncbi:MAG: glycosyltransferase, partial [Planktomarina sp.]
TPDVVMAHSGWGSGTFTKAVWPDTKFIQYLEWWYEHPARDSMFEPNEKNIENQKAKIFSRNLPFLLDWAYADGVVVPTEFQAAGVPEKMRHNMLVMHDGVDTNMFSPTDKVDLSFLKTAPPDDVPVLTYATRGMEPYRGFPQFMQALSHLQKQNKEFHCIIGGTDTIHYGPKLPEGDTWKKRMLEKWDFDMDRIHFTGRLPYNQYRDVLRRSNGHVYLTVPFVLSWSLVESMAIGCPIITNDCAPTREALPGDDSAVFVDFKDANSVYDGMKWALDNPKEAALKGKVARKLAEESYAQSSLYPKKVEFIEKTLAL